LKFDSILGGGEEQEDEQDPEHISVNTAQERWSRSGVNYKKKDFFTAVIYESS
jgi:hypothetical protein